MPIENVYNLAYLGTMYFGSNMQGFGGATFLYDTTFKGVAVTASNCTTCIFKYFNPSKSTTFKGDASQETTIKIQNVTVTGYYGTDQVSLQSGVNPDYTLIQDF